jgi:hypothetical protein
MRFRTPRVVVVGLILCLAALEQWGGSAERGGLGWLTAPDTLPPERVLWEGVAMPLEEARRREAIAQGRVTEAELCQAKLREKLRREIALGEPPYLGSGQRREEDLEDLVRKAVEEGHCPASVGTPVGTIRVQERLLGPKIFPVVSIGQPEIWRLPDLYPPQNMPPLMQTQLQAADFYLIRLFCSFRPVPGRTRVGWARFHVFLPPDSQGRQPIAYDISPVDVTQEVKRHLKFTLAPTLKFRTVVEAEVGKLEFGLEYPELQPVIMGAGVGEAMPTWDYQVATGMAGIQGAKWMHLLVKAPKGMPEATAQLTLTAQIYVDSMSAWIPSVAGPAEQGARLDVRLWPSLSSP